MRKSTYQNEIELTHATRKMILGDKSLGVGVKPKSVTQEHLSLTTVLLLNTTSRNAFSIWTFFNNILTEILGDRQSTVTNLSPRYTNPSEQTYILSKKLWG